MAVPRRDVVIVLASLLSSPLRAVTATVTFTKVSLKATVTGTSVSVTGVVKASSRTTVSDYGIAVQGRSNLVHQQNVVITTAGTTVTGKATFPSGTYTYWLYVNKPSAGYNFRAIGASQTFTVAASSTNDYYKDRF